MSLDNCAIDGTTQRALAAHQAERDGWLFAMTERLLADVRVVAAWLFGSLGRGDADALSDIDLFVIVPDSEFIELVNQCHAFMAQIATPLLVLEAPQNWPPGGVYNMALYPGKHGPHQVDWYWVRQSQARVPTETRLLFDRVVLPRLDHPTHFDYAPVTERPAAEVASQAVNMFWVMWFIAAKYIARHPWQEPLAILQWVPSSLQEVAHFVETTVVVKPAEDAYPSPQAKLDRLRELATAMQTIMPQVVAKGGYIPEQIVPYAHTYLTLIEAISLASVKPT